MDPIVCCILGVCCPPNSDKQAEALASWIEANVGEKATPKEIAKAMMKTFALALK